MSESVLLLNATYEPMLVISWQRAISMMFIGKVEVVETYETMLRSVSLTLPKPAVVRLTRFVRRRRHRVALTRRNVFVRDAYRCQYCAIQLGVHELTIDHVVPRSQGGAASWDNLVSSCAPCNRRKGGRTPVQARMALLTRPERPERLPLRYALNLGNRRVPDHWGAYIDAFAA